MTRFTHRWKPSFRTPIGIFRDVRKPTADELTWEMIEKAKSKKGDVDIKKLLSSGDTWTIKQGGLALRIRAWARTSRA